MSFKELERQRLAAEQQARAAADKLAKQQEASRQAQQKQWEQDQKKRAKELRTMVEGSPVKNKMAEMQRQLLDGIHSDVIVDSERGLITLVWGKYRKVKDGFDYTLFGGVLDYRYITARFNSDQQTIHIAGRGNDPQTGNTLLTQAQWLNNQDLEPALYSAYVNPQQVNSRRPPRNGGRSGNSTGCVGCANAN